MLESRKEPSAAALGPLQSGPDKAGGKHEEKNSQPLHSEGKGDYTAGEGPGHMPATLRVSPRFRTPKVALGALLDEAGCAVAPGLYVDDRLGGVLAVVVGLRRADVAGWKFEVWRLSLKAQSRLHIRLSSCLRVPQGDLNIPDYPPLILEILELQFPSNLLRLMLSRIDQSCLQS